MIINAKRLGLWIRANIDEDRYLTEDRSLIDHMIHFVCIQHAKMLHEQYSLKDIAKLFHSGISPTNSLSDVNEYLDTIWQDIEDPVNPDDTDIELINELNDQLISDVKEYFGQ